MKVVRGAAAIVLACALSGGSRSTRLHAQERPAGTEAAPQKQKAASAPAVPDAQAAAPPDGQSTPPAITESLTIVGQQPSEKLSLDTPTATASRLGLTPRETPATVAIVPRDLIEQRGATDTQEILNSIPGMTAAAPPGSAGSVSYRGFGGAQLTQLFNGLTVQYDAVAARPVDSWIYDRVEVIGGPSTFLYGAGAVGGSINYITKIAERQHDFAGARLTYGSYNTSELAAGVNRRVTSRHVRHAVRGDVSRTGSDGFVDGHARTAWTAAASWRTDFGGALSHTAAMEYQNERVDRPYWGTPLLNTLGGTNGGAAGSTPVPTGEGRIDPRTRFQNYNSRDGRYDQEVVWARSLLEYRPSASTSVRNTLYHYDALRDFRNVEVYRFDATNAHVIRSAALLTRHDQRMTGNRVELQQTMRVGRFLTNWAGGVDVSANQQTRFPRALSGTVSIVPPTNFTTEAFLDVPGMMPSLVPDRTNELSTIALFVENRAQLTPALSLVTGLRHDRIELDVTNHRTPTATDPARFTRTYRPVTGRAGLSYAVAPALHAYVQYSTAADPPAGVLTTASFSQVRDFDLTTGRQVEAGSKFDFWRGRGAATVAAFHITRKNLAIPDPNEPGVTQPVGQQSSRGLEVAASLRVTRAWSLRGNAAYVDARYDDFLETVAGVAVSRAGNVPANTPARVANLWAAYTFSPRIDAGLDIRYVSARFANAANSVWAPAYTLYGGYVAYRLRPGVTLTGRVRNVTDEVYARSVTGTPMFFLGAPRTFELALRLGL